MAKIEPEHAAERSKQTADFAPRRRWTRQEVDGKSMSGVVVATMIKSMLWPKILKKKSANQMYGSFLLTVGNLVTKYPAIVGQQRAFINICF
jgi:hypothetical protein